MIEITDTIAIDERDIELTFIRAGGPGGQNVNKVATAVQLRFDVRGAAGLTQAVRARLEKIAGRKLTGEGVIVLTANRHRTQAANRRDAIDRLTEMIRDASKTPKRRIATKPSKAAKERRLSDKKQKSATKRRRDRPDLQD